MPDQNSQEGKPKPRGQMLPVSFKRNPEKCLATVEACCASFFPFVVTADRGVGHYAVLFLFQLTEGYFSHWHKSYGEVFGWIKA